MATNRNSSTLEDFIKNSDNRSVKGIITSEHPISQKRDGMDAQSSQEQQTESVLFPLPGHPQLSIKRTWPVGGDADHSLCVEYCYAPTVEVGLFHWILWGFFWMGFAYASKVYGLNIVSVPRISLSGRTYLINDNPFRITSSSYTGGRPHAVYACRLSLASR
jgi:hypothetical protein